MAEAWTYDKGSVLDENGFKVAAFVDEEDASTICNAPVNEARVADLQNERDALLSLLDDNLTAWDGEEESVREEHEALIEETREAVDGNRKATPRLAEQVRILREALDEIQRMSGVRGRWLDDDGCAVETEDNDGTDPENKPDGAGEWSAYELDEQNAALECITERALAALEATKEGA